MKKRILSLTLVLAIIMAFVPNMVYAEELQYGDLTYEKYDDHIEITYCDGSAISVEIPAQIDGLPVTIIGHDAFLGCSSLTSISIPDGVTTIGVDAFESCYNLTSITIPSSVTTIGSFAFFNCSSLMRIDVDNGNQHYCSIDGNLFDKSKKILIQYAIGKRESKYIIPNSVTEIREPAFSCCESLTSVAILSGVAKIGEGAFSYSSIINIDVDNQNQYYSSIDGNLFDKEKKTLIQYAPGKKNTKYTFPNDVTVIGDRAFSGCIGLTDVICSNNVINIGSEAFFRCENLKNVVIGENVVNIGNYAFAYCHNLSNISIPNSVTDIGDDAFLNSGLNNIVIPGSVIRIGGNAFKNCNNLTSVTIEDGVKNIEWWAFGECKNLRSLVIPVSVTHIGDSAFYNSGKLEIYYNGSESQWKNIDRGDWNWVKKIHYNSTGPSIESVTHTQEVDSKHYGATKFKYTAEGEVYAAAMAYNKALEEYLKAVKSEAKKISNGNKTLKEKAQSLILKDESAKYKYLRFTTGTGTIPDQPKIGAYMALAEYFDYLADTAESKLNIDLDDEAYMIDAKLTKQILSKLGHYSKTSQQNGWTVSMNIVSFAKQGTGYMTIKKGSISYYAIFSSSPEDVRDALNNFLGEIRDVTDDITKSAAKSLFAEISEITGFGDYYEALIKDSVKKSIKYLRNKGFGNILTVFKKCSDGYDLVHGIIAFSDARHIENALSNAEDIYNKLSKLDYSDSAVDNFIIKQAMNKVNNAKIHCVTSYTIICTVSANRRKRRDFSTK